MSSKWTRQQVNDLKLGSHIQYLQHNARIIRVVHSGLDRRGEPFKVLEAQHSPDATVTFTVAAGTEIDEIVRPARIWTPEPRQAAAYALFHPDLVSIERRRRTTTQGEFSVFYAREFIERFGDRIELQDGEWKGLSDQEIIALVERLYKYGSEPARIQPIYTRHALPDAVINQMKWYIVRDIGSGKLADGYYGFDGSLHSEDQIFGEDALPYVPNAAGIENIPVGEGYKPSLEDAIKVYRSYMSSKEIESQGRIDDQDQTAAPR